MVEVRFHGRGGQGAVMASKILANAFVRTGRYGASFPMFGFERRGAPVVAFGRFSDDPIREKTQIYTPDILVLLDPAQKNSPAVWEGFKAGGTLVANGTSAKLDVDFPMRSYGIIDANAVAMEEIGIPMPNTCMLGAFAAVTGLIDLDSITAGLGDYFSGKQLAANIICATRGFKEVKKIENP
ncbi:MAG: 2-oxoacid:acceptor oxidoreductase family protein [Deltaproteobacteria bacterium]|nr:2-oxoacid:acceptor oxidoreductase family protein [Deltaproteobacteria bacterium]